MSENHLYKPNLIYYSPSFGHLSKKLWPNEPRRKMGRSSRSDLSCRKGVLKNFVTLGLLKVFSCELCLVFKSSFIMEDLLVAASRWSIGAISCASLKIITFKFFCYVKEVKFCNFMLKSKFINLLKTWFWCLRLTNKCFELENMTVFHICD